MFPFWPTVVAPLLEAAEVRRLVEIGALRGENTQLILDRLGPDAELHVIDPVPDFDPDEHRKRFGPGYHFHRALSLDVLGDLPAMDGALVDGDHNWYTVYNELRLLDDAARRDDAPLPVIVCHDVGWPYGRRDLYYDPTNIPDEHRQEWMRKGMRPGEERVVPIGGLNPTLANAVHEGGPRNGVMTGIDDYVAQSGRNLEVVVLPSYFGLCIIVEKERLARQPAVAEFFRWLESPAGKDHQLELAESIRIDAMLFQHQIYFNNEQKAHEQARRYLGLVKKGLVNDLYPELEVRVAHLADCIERERPPQLPSLRDPVRHDSVAIRNLRTFRRTGSRTEVDGEVPSVDYAYAATGSLALDALEGALDAVRTNHVRGDLVAAGVGRGGSAILLRAYLGAYDLDGPSVWVADRFRPAADERDAPDLADGLAHLRPDLNQVRDAFERFELLDERVKFLQGDPDATLEADPERVAVLHLGPGLGADAGVVLERLYPRLAVDGRVVVDVGDDEQARTAITAFRQAHSIQPDTELGAAGVEVWHKTLDIDHTRSGAADGASRSPLAPSTGFLAPELSVVVCVYNMRREAQRTLRSLTPGYQDGIEDLRYEVIVVENGSDEDQKLGEELVRSFGPQFRYVDLGEEATSSPVGALNRGIAESRGTNVALMIDGAHLLTPGVLANAMVGLRAYGDAVVAVQPWYLGPGQQGETMSSGYDQAEEDRLLDTIAWPGDGYRLFEIAHFQGDRDWLDGMWESNCLFVPRSLLEQVGGFDEGFHVAGGGYANLDLYERMGASPGLRLVSVLGEGSFHQVHGGTTTNVSDSIDRRGRVVSYAERYSELRGRPYTGPDKDIVYVGGFHGEADRRTRARRMTGLAFQVDPAKEGPEAPLAKPVPIPDDVRDGFIAAYHRDRGWRETRWLGEIARNAPTDLVAYQEIVFEVRPDWIIETGTRDGGRALFLASICDLVGHGRVVSIDNRPDAKRVEHPRIIYVEGIAHEDDTVKAVRDITGKDPKGMVILGTRGARRRMHRELEAYRPFVSVGSYLVMEHTVLNGYPVQASNGPGPFEAVRRLLASRPEFVPDTSREKHGLSFNLGGFLRRVR